MVGPELARGRDKAASMAFLRFVVMSDDERKAKRAASGEANPFAGLAKRVSVLSARKQREFEKRLAELLAEFGIEE